ncbi:MAG: RbsD/FucU family protein [Clostridia bacterium]|nr:RbsD/FucU family protein [Clostridia bacterium]
MLKSGCIHPGVMSVLSKLGHGDKILIADGNYPLMQRTGDAEKVYLGLTAGTPTVTEVLNTLLHEINVEAACVMDPCEEDEPEIFEEFRQMLPGICLSKLSRYEFYDAASESAVGLAISTGETRVFANILITVGVA